ncbi:MAG TPA: ATP-binding protein [Acidimicrobiales bacterium]|nr:ATP-binding protein [Acidimicrobiales bacterium]
MAEAELAIQLGIPARAEYVALARLVVSSLASSRRELADDRIDDLKVAVSEACTNAIEAHRSTGAGDNVSIACIEYDDRLVVRVTDQGEGFDPSLLPDHPPVTDPERLNFERGLGIPLIRTLVDDLQIDSGPQGTDIRMIMLCPRADFFDDITIADDFGLDGAAGSHGAEEPS